MNLTFLSGNTGILLVCLASGTAVLFCALRWVPKLRQMLYKRYQSNVEYVHNLLEYMHKPVSVSLCRLMVAVSALLTGGLLATATWRLGLIAGMVIGFGGVYLGWHLPAWFVKWMKWRWVRQLDAQLVDGLTLISNGLRAGRSPLQAFDLAQKEMPPPFSAEIKLVLEENLLGSSLETALEHMIQRVPNQDLSIAVNAFTILRETGGNLSETFDTIVATIVGRKKVEGKIRSLTAQGVSQGGILIAMPFVLAYVLNVVNPDYMRPLFNTLIGWILLLFMVLMLLAGGLMIRKIVKIDV